MLRWCLLILVSGGCLTAQIRWKCDPKGGKFVKTLCANCKKMYCWDGEIFSDEPGYTPPPSYVLSYWEEVHRHSEQIRADIERKSKELGEKVQQGRLETERLNQERLQAHKEFMDNLNRRIDASHSSQGIPRSNVTANSRQAVPTNIVIAPVSAALEPPIPPSSRAKALEVQVGMDRAAVEKLLGKPHSAISIPDDDGLIETLSYTLADQALARVRIEKGKVVSVRISE